MRLITMEQLCDKLGCNRSTVYKMMEVGGVPRPVKLPTGGLRWVEGDVDACMSAMRPSYPADGRLSVICVGADGGAHAEIVNDSGSDYVGNYATLSEALLGVRSRCLEVYGETFPVVVMRGDA